MDGHAIFAVAIQALLFIVLLTAATTDLLYRKVFNWTTYPAIAFGLTLGFCQGDLHGLWIHLAGLAVGGGVFGLAALSGGVGPGDWKLAAAIGAIKGFPFIIYGIFYSSLVGAAIALGYLAYRGQLLMGLGRSARRAIGLSVAPLEKDQDPTQKQLPYGVAIAFGTMLAWALVELDGSRGGLVP
jgi:Flp pilus assembly protein protease CpaA